MGMTKENYLRLESSAVELEETSITDSADLASKERVVISGWRLIKNEVFIPPKLRGVLSALVGNGVHLILIVRT